MNTPCMIHDQRLIPISQADYDRARQYQPFAASRLAAHPAPRAAHPASPPVQDSEEVKRKAHAFDALTAEQSRTMTRNSMLRLQGVDPKAIAAPSAAPKAGVLDDRARSRASMHSCPRAGTDQTLMGEVVAFDRPDPTRQLYVSEVTELCGLAGIPAWADGYIVRRVPLAEVLSDCTFIVFGRRLPRDADRHFRKLIGPAGSRRRTLPEFFGRY